MYDGNIDKFSSLDEAAAQIKAEAVDGISDGWWVWETP